MPRTGPAQQGEGSLPQQGEGSLPQQGEGSLPQQAEGSLRPKALPTICLATAFALVASLTAGCGGAWCPPENRCGARCADLETDPNHCGACGVRCVRPAVCNAGVCEAPCPPAYHDGGDGECQPRGRCSSGFHDGGDGVCVAEGECRPGYRDGGDGACYPRGACADGFHNGGDGSCHPRGQCAEGYAIDRQSQCRVPGPCSEGVTVSPPDLIVGRTFPGTALERLVVLSPAPGAADCAIADVDFHQGTAPYFETDLDDLPTLGPGESTWLWVRYTPDHFGRHGGRLVIEVDDPHAPRLMVNLDAVASSDGLEAEASLLDLGTLHTGGGASRWSCITNGGADPATVARVALEPGTSDLLTLDHLPAPGAHLPPDGRLCVRVNLDARRSGHPAGAIHFEIDDALPPVVVQIVAEIR